MSGDDRDVLLDIRDKVTRTDTILSTLVGPDGRVTKVESAVQELRDANNRAKGWMGAIGVAAGAASHYVLDWLKRP